jgi:CheY-like chemotaxis protein/HPt (histidine-containing phosphotransfer) domain-containing protein
MDFIADNQSGLEKDLTARILVVDDDALNQRLIQLLLRREGYDVDVVSSGLEALEAVKVQEYDVVFMDLQMPVMDGVEASRRIREWENGGRHTFIVALTASYLPEKGQELFEAGMDNYISKPFDMEHIRRLLKYSIHAKARSSHACRSHTTSSEQVLDVDRGTEQVGGDGDMYRELLGDFVHSLPDRLHRIQECFDAKDLAGLARAAHNLQGVAASLGALQLSEYARKLDKESVEGYTEALSRLIGEIQLTGAKFIETSNNFLANISASVRSL